MEVEIREALCEDADRICEVNRQSIIQLDTDTYDEDQILAWADAVEPGLYPIEAEDVKFFVAESLAGIVGIGWLKPDADEYFDAEVDGEISGMYVHPDATGCGVGSKLCDHLEQVAPDHDVESLGLWASLNAVSFYEKHGYSEVTEQSVPYGDTELSVVEMQKSLRSLDRPTASELS